MRDEVNSNIFKHGSVAVQQIFSFFVNYVLFLDPFIYLGGQIPVTPCRASDI